jgi:hypothetical protein
MYGEAYTLLGPMLMLTLPVEGRHFLGYSSVDAHALTTLFCDPKSSAERA